MPLMAEQTLFLKGENKMAKLKGKAKAKARKKPNAPKRTNLNSWKVMEKTFNRKENLEAGRSNVGIGRYLKNK